MHTYFSSAISASCSSSLLMLPIRSSSRSGEYSPERINEQDVASSASDFGILAGGGLFICDATKKTLKKDAFQLRYNP